MSDSTATRKGRFDWLTLGSAVATILLTVLLIAIQVALAVRAIRQGRGGLLFISGVALIMAIGASLALSARPIDWQSDAPARTVDPHRPVCLSGSDDCLGG